MAVLPDGARGCTHNPSNPDKVYFFAGDRYWRYDLRRDYGEVRYPASLEEWKLEGSFANGIDAVFDEKGSSPRLTHFFKGDQFVTYDWDSNTVTAPEPISGRWKLGIEGFSAGIDAAVNGEGAYTGVTYFFKGDKYVRYNWRSKEIDVQPTAIASWRIGSGFEDDIEACCTAVRSGQPKTYFFKQGRYVRYDWGLERGDAGYPRPTAAGWPSGLAVWAEQKGAPLVACADARLEAGEDRVLAYPHGTPKGQAGWQLGIRFAEPTELAEALEGATIPRFYGDDDGGEGTIPPESIKRLAIVAPGQPGALDLGPDLKRVGEMLEPGAPVILLGADFARGPAGDALLEALSDAWPDHRVTGFTRVGSANDGRQRRPGEACDNPGLRVAGQDWAHEGIAQHRKTALNGGVVDAHD